MTDPSVGRLSRGTNPLDCDKVDGQLEEVLKLLNSSPPYGTVASRVRRFVQDHAFPDIGPGSVFVPQWETDWKEESVRFPKGQPPFDPRYVVVAEGLEPAQKQALCSVCEAMLRLLFDSGVAYHKEKHLAGLTEALREYLSLRGYDVTIPKGAGEDAPKTPQEPVGGPGGPAAAGGEKGSRPKRSTEKGEARTKIIAALNKHHKYQEDSCLNQDPIGGNVLVGKAKVSKSSVSRFFKKEYDGYRKYKRVCRDTGTLIDSLKVLNQEMSPRHLFSRNPPGEASDDEE